MEKESTTIQTVNMMLKVQVDAGKKKTKEIRLGKAGKDEHHITLYR